MKHIESIQSEYAAGDLSRLLVSDADATASAALTALLHSVTGCAIPQTSDLPQSEVEELVPLCLSILRRHWTTPLTALGDGTTPMSLADLLRQLIGDRVQGNEALGISPANADIPTAVSALTKRHIDDGLTLTLSDGTDGSADGSTTSLPDGLSLAQLLCADVADKVMEIVDNNVGWRCPVAKLRNLFSTFPNIEVLYIGFSSLPYPSTSKGEVAIQNQKIKRIYFTNWVHGDYSYDVGPNILSQNSQLEEIHVPVMKTFNSGGYPLRGFTTGETGVEGGMKLYFDVIESISNYLVNTDNLRSVTANVSYILIGCTGLKSQRVAITYEPSRTTWNTLLDIEIGDKYNIDKGLEPRWVPCQNIHIQPQTLTAENMYNHILCRLKQDEPMCGEGVTITLGTTNIDKIEAVEEYNLKLTELTDIYGYTFA